MRTCKIIVPAWICLCFCLLVPLQVRAGQYDAVVESLGEADRQVRRIILEARRMASEKIPRDNPTPVQQNTLSVTGTLISDLRHFQSINAALLNHFLFLESNPPLKEKNKIMGLLLVYMREIAIPNCHAFERTAGLMATNPDGRFAQVGENASAVFANYVTFLEKNARSLEGAKK